MGAGGLKSCENWVSQHLLKINHTKRTINLAIDMMKYIKEVNFGGGHKLKLKIGIHRGKVIAGVIGFHKPQFSLIGDTVNITARHCSTGDPGMVTISEEAFQEVKNTELNFHPHGPIFMKGKGNRYVYQLLLERKQSLWKTKMEST